MPIQAKDPQEILRASVRICEEAARRHGGASEGAGHRCPEGRDTGQVITPFISQGQPNGNPRQSVITALRACGLLVWLAGAAHGKHQLARCLLVAMPRVSGLRR
jgi:hypothetical protein